ncbi:hypothetical protein [Pseudomonas serbica]|uniref:hypothetical protein n=1 Tax=Pseudomonas serbica TaxID=2965074 RepID=UPI00237C0CD2|nr:hypothetical protein [Pseudomonas serbica]
MTAKTVEMPLDLLNRMSALWPESVGNDGSGGIGFLPHVTETVNEFRTALAAQTLRAALASAEQPHAEEVGGNQERMAAGLTAVSETLQRLMTFLYDTGQRRRATLNRNPSGHYVSATIAGVAPVAARFHNDVESANMVLIDMIAHLNEGTDGLEVDVLRQRNVLLEKAHQDLQAKFKVLTKVPPLYAAVERAAGELPEGWEIQMGIERGAGTVNLFDPDDCEVEFATNHERLDYTVIDALEAAKAQSQGSAAASSGEGAHG